MNWTETWRGTYRILQHVHGQAVALRELSITGRYPVTMTTMEVDVALRAEAYPVLADDEEIVRSRIELLQDDGEAVEIID